MLKYKNNNSKDDYGRLLSTKASLEYPEVGKSLVPNLSHVLWALVPRLSNPLDYSSSLSHFTFWHGCKIVIKEKTELRKTMESYSSRPFLPGTMRRTQNAVVIIFKLSKNQSTYLLDIYLYILLKIVSI
jgi:hypothetical protein